MWRASRRARVSAATVAALPLLVLGTGPADAVGDTGSCTYEANGYADPGFSMTPSAGVDRYEGTITCRGVVNRRHVRNEPGKLRIVFSYGTGSVSQLRGGDDCLAYSGHGTIAVTLATDEGPLTMHGPVESVGGFAGEIHGRLDDLPFHGFVEFQPDPEYPEETCVATDLQHSVAYGQILLGGGPAFG
jgi:hypothetical protein